MLDGNAALRRDERHRLRHPPPKRRPHPGRALTPTGAGPLTPPTGARSLTPPTGARRSTPHRPRPRARPSACPPYAPAPARQRPIHPTRSKALTGVPAPSSCPAPAHECPSFRPAQCSSGPVISGQCSTGPVRYVLRGLSVGGLRLDGGHGRRLRRHGDDLLVVDEVRKQVGGDRGADQEADR